MNSQKKLTVWLSVGLAFFLIPGPFLNTLPTTPHDTQALPTPQSIMLTLKADGTVIDTFQALPADVQRIPMTVTITPPQPQSIRSTPALPFQTSVIPITDGWTQWVKEDFEAPFEIDSDCQLLDQSNDGENRLWGASSARHSLLTDLVTPNDYGGWPAAGGTNSIDPANNPDYPDNVNSLIYCGPFNLSQARNLLAKFSIWTQQTSATDRPFFGFSGDGSTFWGFGLTGSTAPNWWYYNVWGDDWAGDSSVWVLWSFRSDNITESDEGAWLDDLEFLSYQVPAASANCANLDPGYKGVVLESYEKVDVYQAPVIRYGGREVLEALNASNTDWVRLPFKQQGQLIDYVAYDRMVDSLCANGMAVLGLVNYDTLHRQDYTAPTYTQDFTNTVQFIANHFAGRIKYWEVWNEPNLFVNGADQLSPATYVNILNKTYPAIKHVDPSAKVLFGGLAFAWNDTIDVHVVWLIPCD